METNHILKHETQEHYFDDNGIIRTDFADEFHSFIRYIIMNSNEVNEGTDFRKLFIETKIKGNTTIWI